MNNSLDKLIGNDELLTYICLILGIFNTFLMSMVITSIKHNFNIYIFLLFEALFLIFIVYFILKKKDSYNKDDDIKYDWYFYLRVSIITLVFFNFSLYIYNITKDSSKNPRKNGGGPVLSSGRSRSNKVAQAASAAPTDIDIQIELLKNELKTLTSKLTKDLKMLKSRMRNKDDKTIKENYELAADIAPVRERIEDINKEINKLQGESTVATIATSRASARATTRAASNRVVQDPFPYQIADSNKRSDKRSSDISNIMSDTNLTALEKTILLSQLNKLNNAKI